MPGFKRAKPGSGLFDEGPYLEPPSRDRDHPSCRGGSLAFDHADPSFSRGVGTPHCGPDNSAILEQIAAGRAPNVGGIGGPTPSPDKEFELPGWLSPAGVGWRNRDWRFGGIPVTSTSGAFDDVGQRDRAARQQQSDAAESHDRRSTPKK